MKIMIYSDASDAQLFARVESDFRVPVERLTEDDFSPQAIKANTALLDSKHNLLVIITQRKYACIMDWVLKLRSETDIPILLASDQLNSADEYIVRNAGVDDFHGSTQYDSMLCVKIRTAKRWIERVKQKDLVDNSEWTLNKQALKIVSPSKDTRRISHNECKLLDLLLQKKGEVITRSEISQHVFRREWDPTDKSIDMLICKVRGRFRDHTEEQFPAIETVRGVGYMLRAS